MFPNWQVKAEATYGSPTWEILFLAESIKPDLVIVGAQGVSGLQKILLGSVAQTVVSKASCSVRVARGKVDVENSFTRLLLGYDASPGANLAVEKICRRKWSPETELRIVVAKDEKIVSNFIGTDESKLKQTISETVEKLESCGLKVSFVICEGSPKKILVEQSEYFSANCIFVGATSSKKSIKQYLLGSVSSAIVSRANCSVEVVR